MPTALYACVLLMAGVAYYILQQAIIQAQGEHSILKRAIGKDRKAKLSLLLYILAFFTTDYAPGLAQAILVVAGLIWLVPDFRIARGLASTRTE